MTAVPSECDVLVIGLGPAGSSAARTAALAGGSVVAVDRRHEIGMPVQCAEFVPLPMSKYALDSDVFRQHIEGMKTVLPSGAAVDSAFPGVMIDRAKFDQALARQAAEAGALELLETSFESLDAERSTVTVKRHGKSHEIRYRALIAADGPNSRVAEALGLPRLETVDTRQYTVDLLLPYAATDIWLSEDYPGGYAWMFPKGDVANIGLGMDTRLAADLKGPLDALHAKLVADGIVGKEILSRTGGPIPVGGLRERLVVGHVIFVGDAAGLTHPVTGAGIASAVISGEVAGQSVARYLHDEPDALAEYEEEIRDQFETTLRRAVERRRWMLEHWNRPEGARDETHRRGWIAFPEYFDQETIGAST